MIATWDAKQKKYVATYLASSTLSFDNNIENGFKVEGLTNSYLYVYEKNADIDGYGYVMTYNLSATSTSYYSTPGYVSLSYRRSGSEDYVKLRNTYSENYVEKEFNVSKILENRELTAGQFNFKLYEKSPSAKSFVLLDTLTNDKDGNISFDRKYTVKDVGDWIYSMVEAIPSGYSYSNGVYTYQGVQYDRGTVYMKVTVSLNDEGKLQVSEPVFVNSSGEEVEGAKEKFVNTYKASGKITLTGKKKSENASSSTGKYKFTVTEYDKDYKNPVKDADGNLKTVTGTTKYIGKNATGDITFNSLSYTESDIGTHYYIVTEDIPEGADENNCKDGITYDSSKIKLKVTVTDNGNGTLNTALSYEKDKDGNDITIAFVNTYDALGSVTFVGTKTLTYTDIAEDEFEFVVTEYTNSSRNTVKTDSKGNAITYSAGVEAATVDKTTGKSTAKITFPEISYKLSNGDVGTHYYKVTEKIPTDAKDNAKDGVTYSTKSYNVTVSVADGDGKGTLKTTVSYYSGAISFANEYAASGSIQFKGTKTLKGRSLSAQEFTFVITQTTVTDINGNTTLDNTKSTIGYNQADGSIYFTPISYTQADIGKVYQYVIKEYMPEERPSSAYKEGVTYSEESYTVTVEVKDGTKGTLNLVTTVTDGNGQVVKAATDKGDVILDFTNLYNAEKKLTFTATKFLDGRTIEAGQFTFGVYEGDKLVATGTNDADGNVEFETISYYIRSTATAVEKYMGQHNYVIKEIIPEEKAAGYDYDTTEYNVSVNAVDNGNGTISLTVTGATLVEDDDNQTSTGIEYSNEILYSVTKDDDKKANFNNTYGARGSITFAGTKTLEGRSLDKGEFTFEAVEYKIVDDERTATGKVYTGTNDADGNISFETISYLQNGSRNDTGNYVYVVTEVVPEKDKLGGVTYDEETSYEVLVAVTDKGDGTLEALGSANYKSLDFTNSYEATGSLAMDITKKVVDATGHTYNDKTTDGTYMGNLFEFDIYDMSEDVDDSQETGSDENAGDVTDSQETGSDENAGDVTDSQETGSDTNVGDTGNSDSDANSNTGSDSSADVSGSTENNAVVAAEETEDSDSHETEITDTEATDTDGKLLEILYAGAGKKVDVSTFNYTLADVGLHTYKIVEKATENAGYTFDDTVYYVNVLVEDNRDGTLKLTLTDENGEAIGKVTENKAAYSMTFTNTYSATGSVTFKGKKTISHQADMLSEYELGDGDFKFNVYDVTGTADTGNISEKGLKPVTTGVSKADGTVEYGAITYDLSDVGTHTYYILEDSKTTVSGVVNTTAGIIATVVVSNAGDGTLTSKVAYTDSKGKRLTLASFANSASKVSIRKTDSENNLLAGAVLQIADESGNAVATITSEDKADTVVYGLETDKTYTLHEISAPEGYELADDISFRIGSDNQTYIISDGKKKAADVIVMVDELTQVPEDNDTPDDKKTTEKQNTPGDSTGGSTESSTNSPGAPTTGDSMNIPLVMLLMLLSLVVVAGICNDKRKNNY